MRRLLLLITALLTVSPFMTAAAEKLRCKACSKLIKKQYFKGFDGNNYCSKKCLETIFPRCGVCKKICRGRVLKRRNVVYCSRECADKTLPRCGTCQKICRGRAVRLKNVVYCSRECAEKTIFPACATCVKPMRKWLSLPTPYGKFNYCYACWQNNKCLLCMRPVKKMFRLPNGNYVCRYCNKDIVKSLPELQKIFDQVRKDLAAKFNFKIDHPIKLEMRSFSENEKRNTSQEFGFYKYHGKIIFTEPGFIGKLRNKKTTVRFENESCTVIVMDYLPRSKAAEVIAHELAHDYMKHRWFFIKSELLIEGFAELVAAEYNKYCGNEQWNYRMEINPDKIYGDGYRLMRSYMQKGSWQEVYRQLDLANQRDLPPELKK